MQTNQQKISGIQLLRIILIIMVIVLHYNLESSGGVLTYSHGCNTYYAVTLVESLSICAVNVFILISGYFSVEKEHRKLGKVFSLFTLVILYRVVFSLAKMLLSDSFNIRALIRSFFPINYYVYLYCALYCLSPFLNNYLKSIEKRQFLKLLVILLILFSVEPTVTDALCDLMDLEIAGISTISAYGSQEGYTIVNFILLYCIGCYLRKWGGGENEMCHKISFCVNFYLDI